MVTIRAAPQTPPAESHKTMSNWKQGLLYMKVYVYTVDDGIEVIAAQFVSESSFLLERFLDKHSGKCMFILRLNKYSTYFHLETSSFPNPNYL